MATIKGYEFPDDLYYHPDHAWVRIETDGAATIGMNDFFCKEAGDIVYVDLPFEGDPTAAREVCGKLQSSKWIGKMVAPVSGEIVAVNERLESDSTLINQSPYGDGWIARVRPSDWEADKANLIHGVEAIAAWLDKEIAKADAEKKK
jgi:glycine cleavage system H protein